MKRPQVSTNIGIYSIFGGFLNIFQDVKVEDFLDTFSGVTCGEAVSMLLPLVVGVYAILHKERRH